MNLEFEIAGGDFTKAGYASSQVKKMLKQLGVEAHCIKNIVIALYEAEVNVVAHAYEGQILVHIESDKITTKIIDKGPGIPDIEQAMQAGYSTASKKVREMGFGAGMGLPNIKKNTDKLQIQSKVDEGTTVEMVNYF
ncbi:ATP-binding protein [Sunxiuqinia elliptica]|uniref:Anti-sigma regulatory factor (Ser/Thr protein kinase) n=1 Tax=Sunxiuqinia elliptica TaxID=655355 RepID=A0A4R6GNU8_9BACT|nr:ATP-binding protein [Sunxiuqinia elliptica]TDN96687.1 anti-sigma regulatory factor (Ser/Thr protein kinase) [Sunxiuqinia elliptica]TDO55754.1 anti-sigma regulatory factor (Ser/Thr protein kinase) [Sunxiuqinia elliptica]